jgi:hypothetical protein
MYYSTIIIILGQALIENDQLRCSLISRIVTGMNMIQYCSSEPLIILTGGKTGISKVSEASAMLEFIRKTYKNYNSNIILEENSKNTIENAINCDMLLNQRYDITENLDIQVVSNDFHIPRTKCIFDKILCHSKNEFRKIQYIKADSYLDKSVYRNKIQRPPDINLWSFRERLDIEKIAISKLKHDFSKYGINGPDDSQINEAFKAIQNLFNNNEGKNEDNNDEENKK